MLFEGFGGTGVFCDSVGRTIDRGKVLVAWFGRFGGGTRGLCFAGEASVVVGGFTVMCTICGIVRLDGLCCNIGLLLWVEVSIEFSTSSFVLILNGCIDGGLVDRAGAVTFVSVSG